MERRRRHAAGWNGEIPCRFCGDSVALDRRHIVRYGDEWLTTCPSCGGRFPVRASDRDLAIANRPVALTDVPRRGRRRAWLWRRSA